MKISFSMFVLLLASQVTFAQTLDQYLDSFITKEAKDAIATDGKWSHFGETLKDLQNVPAEFKAEIDTRLKGEPTVTIETIFIADNPLGKLDKSDELLRMENILRGISSLKGIEYFSPSRQKMRLLYEESYVIANPKATKPIADKMVTTYGEGSPRLYVYQKDLTFKENTYAWLYNTENRDYMSIYMTNLTPMSYSIIKLVDPQSLKNLVFIKPFEDKILFYTVSTVKTAKLLGLEKSRTDSFYQRTEALFNWFSKRLKEEALKL